MDELASSDVAEMRRRVVEPVVRSLLQPAELDAVEVGRRPPTGHPQDDGPSVWLHLVASGESLHARICSASGALLDAELIAETFYEVLWDWVVESQFAWGQARSGRYVMPPPEGGRMKGQEPYT